MPSIQHEISHALLAALLAATHEECCNLQHSADLCFVIQGIPRL